MNRALISIAALAASLCLTWQGMAATLAEGWTFEDGSEMSRISAWGKAKAELTDEYAPHGKKSLKASFAVRECGVTLKPDITDWTPYEELRFTVHNPQPSPNTKMRVLYINGKSPNAKCSISWGAVLVAPETTKTFSLNVSSITSFADPKNVTSLMFYWGQDDTVFYIDDIKLYTKAEIQALEDAKVTGRIQAVMEEVAAARKSPSGTTLQATLDDASAQLGALLKTAPKTLSFEQEHLVYRAGDAATLASELSKRQAAATPLTLVGAWSTDRIFRDRPLPKVPFDGTLLSARNEAESFQVVALPSSALKDVTVSASKSDNAAFAVPPSWVTINPVGYVEVQCSFYYPSSRTGYWPDILVHNQPLTLANRLQPYFVTVRVPSDAIPGVYRGSIRFEQGDRLLASYPYSVEVSPVTLPVGNRLKTFVDFRYSPKDPVIRRKCYDTLFDNRLQPISMYINGGTPDQQKNYDFVPHLDDLDYCISRGQNMICLWCLVNKKSKDPYVFDDQFKKILADYINYARPIMKAKGIWDNCFVCGFDEIMHHDAAVVKKRLADAEALCTWIKTTLGDDVKIANVGRKMKISPKLMDYYFMLPLPNADFQDIVKGGKSACFYWVYDDPSPMLDLPGMACRILPWRAFREGAEGLAYYSTYRPWALDCTAETAPTGVDWTRKDINIECYFPSSSTSKRGGRVSDGNLFYPDRDGSVLSSTRTANLRDGIEDYELLALLKAAQPTHPLLTIGDEFTTLNTGVYTKDQRLLNARRRAVMETLAPKQR